VALRMTAPTRAGCYRICSGCDHLWHVTAEVLRGETPRTTTRAKRKRSAVSE